MPAAAAAIFWLAAWEFIRTEEAVPLFIAGSTLLNCQLDPKCSDHFFNATRERRFCLIPDRQIMAIRFKLSLNLIL